MSSLLIGAHQVAEHQKAPARELHLCGTFGLALHEPAGGESGHYRGEFGVEKVLPLPGELEKAVVGPDDLVALRSEDDHGEGGVDHGVLGGHIHIAGHIVDIFEDLPLTLGIAPAKVDVEQDNDEPLRRAQFRAEQERRRRKDRQTDEIELETRFQQPGQLLFPHRKTPFCRTVRPCWGQWSKMLRKKDSIIIT